ncbi:hypothetical protein GCM10009817_01890 [Terrabacter lapilli]|uniref:Uncharacterized protein n=1 Tax=Terrabacter lapilli TaxID=436231 RepID=A0ABN2R9U0_9MICO
MLFMVVHPLTFIVDPVSSGCLESRDPSVTLCGAIRASGVPPAWVLAAGRGSCDHGGTGPTRARRTRAPDAQE